MTPLPLIVPVRHHSPACARLVRDLIRRHRPRLVLVEGPADASPLIPALLDPETRPPVALMAYFSAAGSRKSSPRTVSSNTPSSIAGDPEHDSGPSELRPERPTLFYPFCDYSPEWVALREGSAVGAEVRFCDLPAGPTLLHDEEPRAGRPEFGTAIAGAYGFSTHEEWWEAVFEGQGHTPETLMALLTAYGQEVAGAGDPFTALREQWMWQAVEDGLRSRLDPGEVMLVCGAAHAVRFPVTIHKQFTLPKTPPVEFALTPYTYSHLSRRSGYGAGNRTPFLYQRVWELGDLAQASAASLSDVGAVLREGGWASSTADAITAFATATQLAGLRDKVVPGADEIRLVAPTVWTSPAGPALGRLVDDVLVGSATGQVASSAGATPLTADFYRCARGFWRLLDGAARELRLRLPDPRERAQSAFLHQLRVAGIQFAHLRDASARFDPGGALWSRYEVWVRQWTLETVISLAARSPLGSTVREVAWECILETLAGSPGVSLAVETLLDAALCQVDPLLEAAIQAVDAASVGDMPWEDLSRAAARLARLDVDAGLPASIREAASELAGRLFARACLHLESASRCSDERARGMGSALLALHEAVRVSTALDSQLWWRSLSVVAHAGQAQPYLAGLIASLLHSDGTLPAADFGRLIRRRLSSGADPGEGAQFVEGLLSLNRSVLLRSPEMAAVLNGFVGSLRDDEFLGALPLLRRTFGGLSRAEMQRLAAALRPGLLPGVPEVDQIAAPPAEVLATTRRLLQGLLEGGASQLDERRGEWCGVASQLAGTGEHGSSLLRAVEALATATVAEAPARLVEAWDALDLAHLGTLAAASTPDLRPVPGLSLLYPSADLSILPPIWDREQEREENLTAILTDSRPETRPDRVAIVATALEDGPADLFFPLLAHGDYSGVVVRALARRPDASNYIEPCLRSGNALLRRAALRLAAAIIHSDTVSDAPGSDDPGVALDRLSPLMEVLAEQPSAGGSLETNLIWPEALRLLRSFPDAVLEWVQSREPDPASVLSGSPAERRLARLARLLAAFPPAIPWLRTCLAGPDLLLLDASVSLTLLEAQSEDDLRWSIQARSGPAVDRAWLRYELESGARAPLALREEEPDPELAGSLDIAVIRALLQALSSDASGPGSSVGLVEWLGYSRSSLAVPDLGRLAGSSHALLAGAAVEALGRIGSETGVSYLLERKSPRGSDPYRVVVTALGRIGDLRLAAFIGSRLRQCRPEEVLELEMDALRALGEPLRLVMAQWLSDGSPTLQAIAATLVAERAPDRLAAWTSGQSAVERVRSGCSRLLLPGGSTQDLLDQLTDGAREAGSLAVETLVQALRVASGKAELALVRLLTQLRLPATVLPVLRIPRAAAWKVALITAMGDDAVPQLALALKEPAEHVIHAAREALAAIGSAAALAVLDRPSAERRPRKRRT